MRPSLFFFLFCFLFCYGSLLLLTFYFSSLLWKISWPYPFPYLVNTWPFPILILPLHVNYDPSLTMASFLIPIIYNVLLSATSTKFSALSSNERSFHWNKLNSGNGDTKLNFLRTILSCKSLWRTMLITLLKLKCVRKSKVLKVKGSKFSSWNKITMTLNESNIVFLTKYCRWNFMNLICTWYVRE